MVCHMMATFPSATFHFVDSSEILKDEVVSERLEPVNGLIRVPEKPGLGLTLDRDELERLTSRELPPIKPWIVKSQFANGTRMYNRYDPPDNAPFPDPARLDSGRNAPQLRRAHRDRVLGRRRHA